MKKLLLILIMLAGVCRAEEYPEIPCLKLNETRVDASGTARSGAEMNSVSALLDRLSRLLAHNSPKEALLRYEIDKIETLAQTDITRAAQYCETVIARFKAWGVDL